MIGEIRDEETRTKSRSNFFGSYALLEQLKEDGRPLESKWAAFWDEEVAAEEDEVNTWSYRYYEHLIDDFRAGKYDKVVPVYDERFGADFIIAFANCEDMNGCDEWWNQILWYQEDIALFIALTYADSEAQARNAIMVYIGIEP